MHNDVLYRKASTRRGFFMPEICTRAQTFEDFCRATVNADYSLHAGRVNPGCRPLSCERKSDAIFLLPRSPLLPELDSFVKSAEQATVAQAQGWQVRSPL